MASKSISFEDIRARPARKNFFSDMNVDTWLDKLTPEEYNSHVDDIRQQMLIGRREDLDNYTLALYVNLCNKQIQIEYETWLEEHKTLSTSKKMFNKVRNAKEEKN